MGASTPGVCAEVERDLRSARAAVNLARFVGIDAEGHVLIDIGGWNEPLRARSVISLSATDVGARVVVAFERGDSGRPVILGRLQEDKPPLEDVDVAVDNERIVINASREIELRCGEASIVLTRAGKVLIRGTYVLSRSRGANKVKGAFVDIN